jgi:hypothetical protein
MLWYMLMSEELRVWEQRIGAWVAQCQGCHREGWQLTFRIWRTKGTGLSPPTPYGMPYGECYQVRCSLCGAARPVGALHRRCVHERELPAGLRDTAVRHDRVPSDALKALPTAL